MIGFNFHASVTSSEVLGECVGRPGEGGGGGGVLKQDTGNKVVVLFEQVRRPG